MVDITKLLKRGNSVNVTDLLELYGTLDRKSSHTELRRAQIESLQALTETRGRRDHVLKVSTGAGKTTIGLIYLLSHMRESGKCAVYLCPTIQLVEQVCEEANKLGIEAVHFAARESTPDPRCSAGKAVMVCTYDKLFNGLSVFRKAYSWPCAIVIDDAHSGIEIVKRAFTLSMAGTSAHEVVINALKAPLEGYRPTSWRRIVSRDPQELFEVPYWIWRSTVRSISHALQEYEAEARKIGDSSFYFPWQFLKDHLEICRCVVSGTGLEIAPSLPLLDQVPAFSKCPKRLFMSATLVDDSGLVRELGCEVAAANAPIIPAADRGVGERMIIAPSLISADISREQVAHLCAKLAKRGYRVAVLTRSESEGEAWKSEGAVVAVGDSVRHAVAGMRSGDGRWNFVVFPRRYDGVDLADDACRVLVIDGLPVGDGLIDRLDSNVALSPGGARNRLVYRLEQGMGRATRSHADYAVVLLVGRQLADFVVRNEVLSLVNADTRAQLDLAQEFVEATKGEGKSPVDSLEELADLALRRHSGWKQVYDEKVRKPQAESVQKAPDTELTTLAHSERTAFDDAVSRGRFGDSSRSLREIANRLPSGPVKASVLQHAARFLALADDPEWAVVQSAAQDCDSTCFRPPNIARRPKIAADATVHDGILYWFRQFSNPNGAILQIDNFRPLLKMGNVPPEAVERAIRELGRSLGFDTIRPEEEYGEGPDVLWLLPSLALVIEVKSENQASLHKKDSGQLHTSLEWYRNNYGKRTRNVVPVIASRVTKLDEGSQFPEGIRVMTSDALVELSDVLIAFYRRFAEVLPLERVPAMIQKLQSEFGLLPEQILSRYCAFPEKP